MQAKPTRSAFLTAFLFALLTSPFTGCAKSAETSTNAGDCPSAFLTCGGECVDPDTDEAHCGACGNQCAPGVVCSAGACGVTCNAEEIVCNGGCVDPTTDSVYCGAEANCQGDNAGAVCAPNEACESGVCTPLCEATEVLCSGACVDPLTDENHCGASGNCSGASMGTACEMGEVCEGGACVPDCEEGEILCDEACVDPLTDPTYCGATGDCGGVDSGVVCGGPVSMCPGAAPEACDMGACVPACEGTQSFSFTGAPETLVLPACAAEITVRAWGAQGGSSSSGSLGGLGAYVEGVYCIAGGTALSIVVGEQAPTAAWANGGGGGSFVADGTTALFVAGGGGGGYSDWAPGGASLLLATSGVGVGGNTNNDGGGGGGFSLNGAGGVGAGGTSFLNGAASGSEFPANNTNVSRGGFGCGGGASQSGTFNAGGGGGFNGGHAGNGNTSTGGASYIIAAATAALHTPATRMGHGQVDISWR